MSSALEIEIFAAVFLLADVLTTILVAFVYLAPRIRRTEAALRREAKGAMAAIVGIPEPPDEATFAEVGAAVRAHVADETRIALRSELPVFVSEIAPMLEERIRVQIADALPAIQAQVREAIPGLVAELAPIIGDALVKSGQEFFGNKGNISRAAAKEGLQQMPAAGGVIDVAALMQNPQIAGLAQQYGIDPSVLPKRLAVPAGGSPLSVLVSYVPQLKPVVGLIDGLRAMSGAAGMMGGGPGAGSVAPSGGPSSEADRAFAALAAVRR